jgi:serine protease
VGGQSYIRTLSNDGATTIGNYTIVSSQGTSFATPMVSGVVALMFAVNGALTPAQVTAALQSSARPHPANTFCTTGSNVGKCGAGLLDADAALAAAIGTPASSTSTSTGSGGGGVVAARWCRERCLVAGDRCDGVRDTAAGGSEAVMTA